MLLPRLLALLLLLLLLLLAGDVIRRYQYIPIDPTSIIIAINVVVVDAAAAAAATSTVLQGLWIYIMYKYGRYLTFLYKTRRIYSNKHDLFLVPATPPVLFEMRD